MYKYIVMIVLMLTLSCKEGHNSCECIGIGVELCDEVCESIVDHAADGMDVKIALLEFSRGFLLFEVSATQDGELLDPAVGIGQFSEVISINIEGEDKKSVFQLMEFGTYFENEDDYPRSIQRKIDLMWGSK